jgi:hypothetical protein
LCPEAGAEFGGARDGEVAAQRFGAACQAAQA